jgi:hypothetical protein
MSVFYQVPKRAPVLGRLGRGGDANHMYFRPFSPRISLVAMALILLKGQLKFQILDLKF